MTAALAASDVERFRGLIVRRLGLQFENGKLEFLADALRRRLDATGTDAHTYLARLDAPAAPEVAALAEVLTVAETYCFRHVEQFRAFAEVALPDAWSRAALTGARPSIVSAGCATGEEPYSLAITVRDAAPDRADSVSILGVDINPIVIEKARRGRLSPWALRETPPHVQRRWFTAHGREFALDETIRRAVSFEVRNLATDDHELWRPESHDVVFCRNVLMYFAPDVTRVVIDRIARALRPGGYLFLGHAETLRGVSTAFHLCHTHGTFYYQKKERGALRPAAAPALAALEAWSGDGTPWVDAIDRASDRIRTLVEAPAPEPERPADANGPDQGRPVREIGRARELLRDERFTEALDILGGVATPVPAADDSELLLLQAVLHTHAGQLVMAERVCERLLAKNELHAEAHYLIALCREGAGDRAGALHHDRVAVYLAPGFAMAQLHLGLMALRSDDLPAARRALRHAMTLLEREDETRLLLFGGGFTRDALIGLCRSELRRCGGQA